MAEPEKQQLGDGSDHYGQAAKNLAQAAKQAEQLSRANSAAAAVKAGAEGGTAAAQIAAGTAAGGPWGAILSAAWAMRHTIFKLLVCLCLVLTVFIVMIVSLPGIVVGNVFGLNGTPPASDATLMSVYTEMADAVSDAVEDGYDQALSRVEQMIAAGDYDYDLSMEALVNYAQSSAGYDVCYILAAYSASMGQRNTLSLIHI